MTLTLPRSLAVSNLGRPTEEISSIVPFWRGGFPPLPPFPEGDGGGKNPYSIDLQVFFKFDDFSFKQNKQLSQLLEGYNDGMNFDSFVEKIMETKTAKYVERERSYSHNREFDDLLNPNNSDPHYEQRINSQGENATKSYSLILEAFSKEKGGLVPYIDFMAETLGQLKKIFVPSILTSYAWVSGSRNISSVFPKETQLEGILSRPTKYERLLNHKEDSLLNVHVFQNVPCEDEPKHTLFSFQSEPPISTHLTTIPKGHHMTALEYQHTLDTYIALLKAWSDSLSAK
ncbi:MAG: hypothetical protein LW809_03645 [Vampirovibrionales bacterium]|jgi:hypothetical protein|nr:hypothetical protein [Vampirovibrionales bacterium]